MNRGDYSAFRASPFAELRAAPGGVRRRGAPSWGMGDLRRWRINEEEGDRRRVGGANVERKCAPDRYIGDVTGADGAWKVDRTDRF